MYLGVLKWQNTQKSSGLSLVVEQVQVPSRDSNEYGCHLLLKGKANGGDSMTLTWERNFWVLAQKQKFPSYMK